MMSSHLPSPIKCSSVNFELQAFDLFSRVIVFLWHVNNENKFRCVRPDALYDTTSRRFDTTSRRFDTMSRRFDNEWFRVSPRESIESFDLMK